MRKNKDENKKTNRFLKKDINDMLIIIMGAIVLSYILSLYAKPGTVVGDSMNATMHNGDYVLINRMAYNNKEPKFGDIVILNTNVEGGKILIKRVIGTSGDTVEITNNQLYINGEFIEESYIYEPMVNNENIKITVEKGKIFVMGDNRNHSLDSRSLMVGTIDYKIDVLGKVVLSLFPFNSNL